MSTVYKIKDWSDLYENHETRKYKNLSWVPVPNKHDGRGFKRIMKHKCAAGIYAAWNLILQIASKMPVRGVLEDKDGPLTAQDLSDKTDLDIKYFEIALSYISSKEIGWIEKTETEDSPAIPPDSPAICRKTAAEQNRTEQNRTEKKEEEACACDLITQKAENEEPDPQPEQKDQYHDYVFLKKSEYDRLVGELGKHFADVCIKYFDEYLTNHPEKRDKKKGYVDHNKAIRNWVIDAVKEKKKITPSPMHKLDKEKNKPPPEISDKEHEEISQFAAQTARELAQKIGRPIK